jgi:hypothetical protein
VATVASLSLSLSLSLALSLARARSLGALALRALLSRARVLDHTLTPSTPVRTLPSRYSLEGHRELIDPGLGVTVVMTFFYTHARFPSFLANAQTYCSYSSVKRVIIVWHNRVSRVESLLSPASPCIPYRRKSSVG